MFVWAVSGFQLSVNSSPPILMSPDGDGGVDDLVEPVAQESEFGLALSPLMIA